MDNRDDKAFVEDGYVALYGSVNGVLLHDVAWPLIVIALMKLILQDNYTGFVSSHGNLASLIVMIFTSLITLGVALIIAKPKILLQAYKKYEQSDIKFIFACFGAMLLFNLGYNSILLLSGVDVVGGNANQAGVVELISANPILSILAMIILAPLLEEITYRYFIYGGIAKFNRKWAIIISGFIFMCVHGVASFTSDIDNMARELLMLPPYMFSGMVLAYAYDKKQNLLIPTSIHALNNLISFILCLI